MILRRSTADRQTIIALRATHTAHRVATAVQNPELPPPARTEPANIFGDRPIVDYQPRPVLQYYAGPMPRRLRWLFFVLIALVVVAIVYHLSTDY